jgi:hypothetical protein
MKTALRVEGEITEDGHLVVELPPETPRGRVVVTLEPVPERGARRVPGLHPGSMEASEDFDAPLLDATPGRELHYDLDHLAGTWSEEEAEAFDAALAEQRRVDPEIWK